MGIEIEGFVDEWGPEKILHVYDPEVGMKGVLVIDNTALGPGKGESECYPQPRQRKSFVWLEQ